MGVLLLLSCSLLLSMVVVKKKRRYSKRLQAEHKKKKTVTFHRMSFSMSDLPNAKGKTIVIFKADVDRTKRWLVRFRQHLYFTDHATQAITGQYGPQLNLLYTEHLIMDGLSVLSENLSRILFSVDECLPNLQTLVIKNNQGHICLKDALRVEGEDEGDDSAYVMKGTNLESISFDPGLVDGSDEDMKSLYLFLVKNPTILSMKVLERQTFDVDNPIYGNHIKNIEKLLEERHFNKYGWKTEEKIKYNLAALADDEFMNDDVKKRKGVLWCNAAASLPSSGFLFSDIPALLEAYDIPDHAPAPIAHVGANILFPLVRTLLSTSVLQVVPPPLPEVEN